MAAGSDEDDAEWAGPIERDVRSVAGWDGEGEGEGTPLEDEEEEADGDQIPLTLDALYRDGDVDPERPDDAGADDGTRGTDADDDAATCPVCFRPLRDLADTDAARLAHVNACLDDGGWRDEEDDGHPVSDESPPVAPSDTREDDDAIGATWDEGGEGEWHDVAAWLHAVDHGDFAPIAVVARLTFAALEGCADESALAALGHVGDGARRRALLAAVDARRRGFAAPASAPTPKGGHPAAADASKGWHPTRAPAGVAPVFALARGERHAVRRPEPALESFATPRPRGGFGGVGSRAETSPEEEAAAEKAAAELDSFVDDFEDDASDESRAVDASRSLTAFGSTGGFIGATPPVDAPGSGSGSGSGWGAGSGGSISSRDGGFFYAAAERMQRARSRVARISPTRRAAGRPM